MGVDGNQQSVIEGDWSWQQVRRVFYLALTAATDTGRQADFAQTFRGLGHQMHLVQDMSQPDHARDDAHPADGGGFTTGLETWTKENNVFITCLFQKHNTLSPDTLSKCQQYNVNGSVDVANYYPAISN
jgi:hypothetical protein